MLPYFCELAREFFSFAHIKIISATLPSINSTNITFNFSLVMLLWYYLLSSVLGLFGCIGLWILLPAMLLPHPKHWHGVRAVLRMSSLSQC